MTNRQATRNVHTNTSGHRVPPGQRIYAIGDIHGRYDLLLLLEQRMRQHLEAHPVEQAHFVFIGDYVDRGPQSRQVIEHLLRRGKQSPSTFLMGNHEWALLGFLEGRVPYHSWVYWGGDATLKSYGVVPVDPASKKTALESLRHELASAIPDEHLAFLNRLTLMHHAGDYVFVHAGIKPGVPLTEQDENDLLMIRDEFFNQSLTENKTVVHGHTVFPEPFIRARSIGIDTGAYASNILTAVALQDDHYEFITTDRGNL